MDIPPLYPVTVKRHYPLLTDDERAAIKTLWAEGLSALAIAQRISRDPKTVVKALGTSYRNNRLTEDERTVIETLWTDGLSAPAIAQKINRDQNTVVKALGTAYHSNRHGGFGTPEYKVWEGMKSRCYKPTDRCYYLYGGRGITVCDAWRSPTGFPQFLAEVGLRPSPQHRLDRINNNGNYEPGNVRWATPEEQANNQRTTIRLTVNGRTQTLMQWCRELGLNAIKVRQRYRDLGWTAEEALDLVPPTPTRRSDAAKARCTSCQRDEQGRYT